MLFFKSESEKVRNKFKNSPKKFEKKLFVRNFLVFFLRGLIILFGRVDLRSALYASGIGTRLMMNWIRTNM